MRRSKTFWGFLLFSAVLLCSARSHTDDYDQLKEAYDEARQKIDQLTESLNLSELKVLQLNQQLEANKQQCSAARGCGIITSKELKWPWVAVLLRDGNYSCGGSVITDRHILTAAHCVRFLKPTDIKVRLGEFDFNVKSSFEVDFAVEKIIEHPAYNRRPLAHDIAILKLKESITFTNRIKPLCLPSKDVDVTGKSATEIGWGRTSSGVLKEAVVEIWTQEKCRTIYPIGDDQMCADHDARDVDACQLYSGGPLMLQTFGSWSIVGIVSSGNECVTVYTRITAHLDWIKQSV